MSLRHDTAHHAPTAHHPMTRATIDGVAGWFIPDDYDRTAEPPQVFCRCCGYLAAAERNYRALCMTVNRRYGGIAGVTCGTDGYDETTAAAYRARVRLEAKANRRRLAAIYKHTHGETTTTTTTTPSSATTL